MVQRRLRAVRDGNESTRSMDFLCWRKINCFSLASWQFIAILSTGQARPAMQGNQIKTNQTMKTTLNTSDIARSLHRDDNANWSWNGAKALAEHLEQLEEDTGEEMEFDAVAIRCDFSEYESLEAWASDYFRNQADAVEKLSLTLGMDGSIDEDSEEIDDMIRSYIQDHGTLIEFDGGVIVSSF